MKLNSIKYVMAIILIIIVVTAVIIIRIPVRDSRPEKKVNRAFATLPPNTSDPSPASSSGVIKEAGAMPVYGHWRNFTTKDGLPSDKAYTVRIDGNRVLVGTHDGLAVYENDKWHTLYNERWPGT